MDDVVLTAGAMGALHVALRAVGRRSDEVVIPVPSWLDHPLYVLAAGMRPVPVAMTAEFDLDIDRIAAAFTPKTRAVLLSHPANPTGRVYGPTTWRELHDSIEAAERRFGTAITLIADEAHRDFVPTGHRSAAHEHERTIVTYSFGKWHQIQGQRVGYVAVSPRHPDRVAVREELEQWTRVLASLPSALMQSALPRLPALRHDGTWAHEARARLVDSLRGLGYDVAPGTATLFVYARTPDGLDDVEFVQRLATAGVLVLPAPVFHHAGGFRLALTASDAMMGRALDVLAATAPT